MLCVTSSVSSENFYVGKDGTKWSKVLPFKNVRTPSKNIVTHLPGVKKQYRNLKTPVDCLLQILDDDILGDLVNYTNIYISTIKDKFSRERDAFETNVAELKALFGLLYYAGVLRAAHLNAKDLWSTDGFGVTIFRNTMTLNRFHFLLRCIRFDNINSRSQRKETDRLASIRDIFEKFLKNIQKLYSISEYCTVDEKLEAFRGRCQFRQYMRNKPAKYGIKIFALCDSRTFYTYNLEIYAGQQPIGPYRQSNTPSDVVKRIISPIKGTCRNITMDNWFMSVPLATDLLHNYKLTCVGTLRKNKREIPLEFLPHKGRPVHSSLFGFKNKELTLTSYVPKKCIGPGIVIYA
ncbi:uncharacterized protein LOC118180546 [Stegodyphus dumicola]|nr:uncharacterized protein LOC118180546 [Stegodyphus dumicola]